MEPRAGIGQPGIVLGLALEVAEALAERLAAPLGLGLSLEGRPVRLLGVLAEFLDDLELGDVLAAALLQVAPGARNEVLGQVEPARDLERVRLADVADVQPESRAEGLEVELDRRVLGARVRERVGLQVADVGRDDRPAADAVELVEDRAAERGPFGGVGPGPQLVEQDERALGRLREDLGDAADVRGEGRERLLQALLVADVGEHGVEDRELRPLVRRDV